MNKIKYLIALLLLSPLFLHAQQPVEMADKMRSEGKIYVVVAILLVILIGLIAYLFMLDRKITRLEKKVQEKAD